MFDSKQTAIDDSVAVEVHAMCLCIVHLILTRRFRLCVANNNYLRVID